MYIFLCALTCASLPVLLLYTPRVKPSLQASTQRQSLSMSLNALFGGCAVTLGLTQLRIYSHFNKTDQFALCPGSSARWHTSALLPSTPKERTGRLLHSSAFGNLALQNRPVLRKLPASATSVHAPNVTLQAQVNPSQNRAVLPVPQRNSATRNRDN